ncbi:MAG: GHKL domain-containing protein [Deltaproteobacteria bacterium]|nr:GHKL domain-containing protein [Deltaproteobacteria bacterium]
MIVGKIKPRINFVLSWLLLLSMASLLSFVFFFSIHQQNQKLRESFRESAIETIGSFISTIRDSLFFDDLNSIKIAVGNLNLNPNVLSASVLSKEGDVLVSLNQNGETTYPILESSSHTDDVSSIRSLTLLTGQDRLEMLSPVDLPDGSIVGYVKLNLSLELLNKALKDSTKSLLLIFLIAGILAFGFLYWLGNVFSRSLANLGEISERIGKGESAIKIGTSPIFEFSTLLHGMKQMATNIEFHKSELRKAKEYTDHVVASVSEAILVVNGQGRVEFANARSVGITGFTPNELLEMKFPTLITQEDGAPILWEGDEINEMEAICVNKSGEKIPVLLNRRIMQIQGLYVFSLKDQRDSRLVTELRRTQFELIQSSKMAALGEMAGGVAHEINNPLGVIMMRANQIARLLQLENADLEQAQKFLQAIEKTGIRIKDIVAGLQSFARTGKDDIFLSTSVARIVKDTLVLCSEKFFHNGIDLKVAMVPEDVEIKCNHTQISQVLLNLLSNAFFAVKESPGKDKWVELQYLDQGENIRLMVVDCGEGIPEKVAEKIFQPFYTTKPVGQGTGLGLSISKGIVEAHGGSLYLDKQNKNTAFGVILPKELRSRQPNAN